jgi:hypothetical protein
MGNIKQRYAGVDTVFFWINPVDKCTRSLSAGLRQQRTSDVMTYIGHSTRDANY